MKGQNGPLPSKIAAAGQEKHEEKIAPIAESIAKTEETMDCQQQEEKDEGGRPLTPEEAAGRRLTPEEAAQLIASLAPPGDQVPVNEPFPAVTFLGTASARPNAVRCFGC